MKSRKFKKIPNGKFFFFIFIDQKLSTRVMLVELADSEFLRVKNLSVHIQFLPEKKTIVSFRPEKNLNKILPAVME